MSDITKRTVTVINGKVVIIAAYLLVIGFIGFAKFQNNSSLCLEHYKVSNWKLVNDVTYCEVKPKHWQKLRVR